MISIIFDLLWNTIDSVWNWMRVIFLGFGIPAEVLIIGFVIITGILFAIVRPFIGNRRHFKD